MTSAERSDEGFTLIEVLVASMVSLLVLIMVGGLLINTIKTERTVSTATQDTSSAQLVAKSVSQGVRNATDFWHSPAGSVPELLMTRTIGPSTGPDWVCRAWSFADGQVRTFTSSTAIAKTQTTASVQSWTLLADGVEATTAGSVALPVFDWSGRSVDLDLNVRTGTPDPTLIHTTAVSRLEPSATGAPCF